MSLTDRIALYNRIEALRSRPLIVYVTSPRVNAAGMMSGDVVPEFLAQLQRIPAEADGLDVMIVSQGGDPTVAWRIVSLVRERVDKFSVLIPQAAFSAATLVALGADEIIMHPFGNLGPVDPQIMSQRKDPKDGTQINEPFSPQDLAAFLNFAREEVGVEASGDMLKVFELFCSAVGAVRVGYAARSTQLMLSMSEKLLGLHTPNGQVGKGKGGGKTGSSKAKEIVKALNTKFFHHGYPVSRKEAAEIGLDIAPSNPELESLMWNVWLDVEREFLFREPFNPVGLLAADARCAALFQGVIQGPVTNLQLQVQMQVAATPVPTIPYDTVHGIVESPRWVTRFVTEGKIVASRAADMSLKVAVEAVRASWREVPIP